MDNKTENKILHTLLSAVDEMSAFQDENWLIAEQIVNRIAQKVAASVSASTPREMLKARLLISHRILQQAVDALS